MAKNDKNKVRWGIISTANIGVAKVIPGMLKSREFEVRVYAGRGEPPSEPQARAFAAFRADDARYAAEMVQTVFEIYQEVCEIRRKNWPDRHVDDLSPS